MSKTAAAPSKHLKNKEIIVYILSLNSSLTLSMQKRSKRYVRLINCLYFCTIIKYLLVQNEKVNMSGENMIITNDRG